MKPVLFADLDDTLFRSFSRLGGETEGMTQVTVATNGNHSWMNPRQSRFMDWALNATEVIPVTARSREAFSRVSLNFPGIAVLSNGALILDANGIPDPCWSARTRSVTARFAIRLGGMLAAVQQMGDDTRAWVVREDGADIYLCVKSNNSGPQILHDLDRAEALLTAGFDTDGLLVHRNGNNMSITPREISKRAAVEHLLATISGMAERVLFGAGDSLTDLPFMGLTDFMLVPPTSQIARRLEPPSPAELPTGSAGSGSYESTDVRFLLKAVEIPPVDIATKEDLIQSGARHYSEMISTERRPDARYMEIFDAACVTGIPRMARELAGLADQLAVRARENGGRLALCSLVRAGVPYGVILLRRLRQLGVETSHFGVSIIRDRGLDAVAMTEILRHFQAGQVVFVDGWTGKGTISGELEQSWRALTGHVPCLAVLADPCGRASVSGSYEDWLIPSGILGGCISGLVSRSILNSAVIGKRDFHGCLLLDDMRDIDRSRAFVDAVWDLLHPIPAAAPPLPDPAILAGLRDGSEQCIAQIATRFKVPSCNLIKPGIAEATRAVLRRRPEKVFLRAAGDPDLAALHHLCATDGVQAVIDPELTGPYRAITLIQRSH